MKIQWTIWFILGSINVSLAQDTLFLNIEYIDSKHEHEREIFYKSTFSKKNALNQEIQNVIKQLKESSYLEANVSKIIKQDSIFIAKIKSGKTYNWAKIINKNVPEIWLKKMGIQFPPMQGKKISAKEWNSIKTKILDYAQENGYPFAQIRLDSITTGQHEIGGQIVLKKNQYFQFGKIIIHGEDVVSPQYLKRYLGIRTDESYQQKIIADIPKKLDNLPFLSSLKSPKLRFIEGKANIHLFLKQKPLNRFDLIFGVAPNNNIADPRKVIFTGNGKIDLFNSFKHGERFQIDFEYLEKGTQSMDLSASYPYLFQLPFGGNVGFGLYKKDTSYLNIKYHIGLSYEITPHQNIETFFKKKQTNLLNIDEESILYTRQLPNNLDVSTNSFGITYRIQTLDYRFNPRKGWNILFLGSFGQKNILKSNLITNLKLESEPNFNFETLYNNIELNQNQYQFQSQLTYFIPLGKHSTIMSTITTNEIFSNGLVLENELLQIGGSFSIRGFNENQFLASHFSSMTLEYRWILQKNAHIFLFSDMGYLEKKTQESFGINRLIGLGTGFRFETKSGIFGLSIAIGRDFALPKSFFDFRTPKIHFGFLNLF